MKRTIVLILVTMVVLAAVACQSTAEAPAETPTAAVVADAPTAAVVAETPTANAPGPTATAEAVAPTATAPAPGAGAFALCPEVPRPAVALSVAGESYLVTNPLSGKSCEATLDGGAPANFQVGGDAVYWVAMSDEGYVVRRLGPDGQATNLAFTARSMEEAMGFYNFAVAADGRQIAWSAGRPAADDAAVTVSEMWVAGTDGSEVVSPLGEQRSGEMRRGLAPVRFSADGSTLFYTWQPLGVGGSWMAFNGRYDNIYPLRLRTDAQPTAAFDCADFDLFLCLGDFLERDGQASLLAYVDDGALVIQNGLGDTLNTLAPGADYVAYPTFNEENGELVFYTADLSEDSILPAAATVYRVAPHTAPAEALASSPNLLPPQAWLDDTRVVVGYAENEMNWGTAVVGLDGTVNVMQAEPNANFVAILNETGAPNPPAVGFGPRATYEDEVAGVAIDYPEGWNVLDVEQAAKEGSPVYAVTFFSWDEETTAAGGEGIPEGGTKFDLVVMTTEATSLEEAIAERKAAMAEGEMPEEIVSEERWLLAGGLEAVRWVVEGRDTTASVVLTYVDGRTVMISGLGNLGLVDAISRTLRPL